MSIKRALLLVVVAILFGVIGYSSFRLWDIYSGQAQEQETHRQMLAYRPSLDSVDLPEEYHRVVIPLAYVPVVNQSVIDLQAVHPSVVGWLSIPNTLVEHPVVQGTDNVFYLHRNIHHESSAAGTIFMDHRNSSDFSDFNTLIYGHNMRNASMFGSLRDFLGRHFFDITPVGHVFLPYRTYAIEWFAFAVIRNNDGVIYGLGIDTYEERYIFLNHVRNIAMHYRDVDVTVHDRLVTLSTCRNDAANSRMILVGVLR